MLNNKALGLTILAILVMLMAVYLGERRSDTEEHFGGPVFDDLQENLPALDRVEIRDHDARTTLARDGGAWAVEQRDGYPVDFSKLTALLDSLKEARYEERKTSRPGNFAALGLRDIEEGASEAVLVRLTAGDDQYQLLIGSRGSGGRGQLVRHPDEQQVWLVDETIEVTADPVDWLDPVILDIPADRIVRVRHVSGQEILDVRRQEDGNLVVENLPEGAALRYPTVADQLARALDSVRLKDVGRLERLPGNTAKAIFDLVNGEQITAHAWQEGERFFLAFDRTGEAESSAIEAWRFEVSRSIFDRFTRTMADMIEPAEEEDAESSESS